MARSKKKTTNAVARDTVTLNSVFTGIADAIRAKTGGSDTITPRNMGNAIRGIKGVTEASLPEANLPAVFQDIANAIRACGITGTMTPSEMPQKIQDCTQSDTSLTRFVVSTSHANDIAGIYSAQRNDTSKPVVIDWGDGTIEQVNGNISQKVHTYSSVNQYEVTVSNVKTFRLGSTDGRWIEDLTQNIRVITEVELGDNITEVVDYAFAVLSQISSIILPNSIITIGSKAFFQISPHTIIIPESVTSIGEGAFSQCTLTDITIPSSVSYIENYAFQYIQISEMTFLGKTISQLQSMTNYPFGINIIYYGQIGTQITINCSDGSFIITQSCILKGTDILLADNTTKKIEDLTYDDILKVWDFDEGQLDSAKVCWLTCPGLKSNHYYQLTFDNGTVLKTTGINSNHRIFSVDQSKFTNVADAKVGDKVFSIDGTLTITDVKYVEEECEYYNVITSGKINCFANGILTSDRYGNLYPIADMKYVKDGRTIRPYSEYEAVGIDRYWYDNLRLGENTETVEKSKEYVWKCIGQMLPVPN